MTRCPSCLATLDPGATECPGCRSPVPSSRPIQRLEDTASGGVLSGRYEILRELGAGGMGTVWLAHDSVRDELVAVKILMKVVAHDPVAMIGIRREANLSLKLTHPNVLRLLNLELAPFPFLLMEYVQGMSLQSVVAERMETSADGLGRLAAAEVAQFLGDLADGLDYAHDLGIIHRDIKPANIMLVAVGDRLIAKITDFGIAAQLRDTATHFTQQGMAGTPLYMSPEQLKRRRIDRRVDIYALGITLYQLLTGSLPFLTEYQIHNDEVPCVEGLDPRLHQVLARSLARDPDQRYQTTGALASDFAAVVVAMGEAASVPIGGAPGELPQAASTGTAATMTGVASTSAGGPATDRNRTGTMTAPSAAGSALTQEAVSFPEAVKEVEPVPPPPPPPPPPDPVEPPGYRRLSKGASGAWEFQCLKDGSLAVLVNAGPVTLGRDSQPGQANDAPVHRVTLSPYLMDLRPVTNRQFRRFVEESGYVTEAEREGKGSAYDGKRFTVAVKGAQWRHPRGPDSTIDSKDDHPVVQVSWFDAMAYCEWTGKRLPTESEWEKAARGGLEGAAYPWGNAEPAGRARWGVDGPEGTSPVGQFPPNGLGLVDMAGNVWEWVADWYAPDGFKTSDENDPKGPADGSSKVLRGGTWYGPATQLNCAYRSKADPHQRNSTFGFRAALSYDQA